MTSDKSDAHHDHDHIAAVFADRGQAERAVEVLREQGFGSQHLGIAVHDENPIAFEHDADAELVHDVEVGRRLPAGFFSRSGLDHTPGYAAMVDLIADELGDTAADALRAPFALGDTEDVRDLLTPVGADVRVDEIVGTARFASIANWVHTDVRGWTLADLVDDLQEVTLVARAERELARFVSADGSVEFPSPAIVGTAVIGH